VVDTASIRADHLFQLRTLLSSSLPVLKPDLALALRGKDDDDDHDDAHYATRDDGPTSVTSVLPMSVSSQPEGGDPD